MKFDDLLLVYVCVRSSHEAMSIEFGYWGLLSSNVSTGVSHVRHAGTPGDGVHTVPEMSLLVT